MFKAKKWMLSRAAETKLGRSTVIKFIGRAGNEIIEVFKSSTTKINGRKVAKRSKRDTIKIALKIVNMMQAKKLSLETEGMAALGDFLIQVDACWNEALRESGAPAHMDAEHMEIMKAMVRAASEDSREEDTATAAGGDDDDGTYTHPPLLIDVTFQSNSDLLYLHSACTLPAHASLQITTTTMKTTTKTNTAAIPMRQQLLNRKASWGPLPRAELEARSPRPSRAAEMCFLI